jgi:hypothetical protein
MSAPALTVKEPRRTRSRVLFEDFSTTAETVRQNPTKWHLVGGGPDERYGVFSQTAYRIRRGEIRAFADPQGGYWEVQVSTDKNITDRDYPVEVYLRWVPVGPKGIQP